ncbi:MAG TPA: hypothetical protein VFU15_02345, partial [Bacteroidia bacterium]|nr:hypothetical protein [Bacteroidia bacterium]
SCFLPQDAHSQETDNPWVYHISVDLQSVAPDKDRVKVTIMTPPVNCTKIEYILPEYVPGIPTPVNAGRFVHQFYALDDKGFPLKVTKKSDNVIVLKMRKGAVLKKIEYWVDDTWDMEKTNPRMSDEKFNYVPQPAGTNFQSGSSFVLNHAFLFGYLSGYSSIPYYVSVIHPDDLSASGDWDFHYESPTRESYSANSYAEFVERPVMFSVSDTCGFRSGNIYVHISVFSENEKVTARLVRRLIAAQITSETNFIPDAPPSDYYLLFYFTTPFKTVLNVHGGYGGLAHAHNAFYFLAEQVDEDMLASDLQSQISGDLLHLMRPVDLMTTCGNADFLKPQVSPEWWFSQGTAMYFSWLSAVRDSFVSEEEFMSAVSAKVKLSGLFPLTPIAETKSIVKQSGEPLKREALKARAMLLAMLLDITLTESTGGKTGLREAVMQMNAMNRFYPDSLNFYLERIGGVAVKNFIADYVTGEKSPDLIRSFNKIGWAYAPETIDSVLTFGRFGLLYDEEKDVFFVHNADTTNAFGLRDGDRVVSINGVIVSAGNFDETMGPVYSPKKDEAVDIIFIRGSMNLEITAYPKKTVILVEHLIRMDPAAGSDALLLHQRIFTAVYN